MHKLSIALLLCPALGWAGDFALPATFHASSVTLAQDPEVTPSKDVAKWIRALGSADDAERASAREALKKAGAEASAALETAARESTDPEVRWNARKLLRQMEEEAANPAPQSRLEPLRRRAQATENDPRFREIGGAPEQDQESQPGANRGVSKSVQIGPDGRVKVTVTENIDGQRVTKNYEANSMEELRAKHPGVLGDVSIGIAPMPNLPGMEGMQDLFERLNSGLGGLDMQREGGIRGMNELWRELRLDQDQGSEPQVPGLDEEQLRPLREALKDLGRIRAEREESHPGFDVMPTVELAPAERLGVKVEALHPAVAQYFELPEGTGLIVAEVLEGTLAQSLGLQAKDILLRIQDQAVRTPETIRAALAKTPLDQKVRVEVLRYSSGKVTVEAKRPATTGDQADGLPAHGEGPKRLERRDARK